MRPICQKFCNEVTIGSNFQAISLSENENISFLTFTDYCSPNPCKNGGTCVDQSTGQCSCKTGFDGIVCEQCSPGYFNYPNCKGIIEKVVKIYYILINNRK